MPRYEALDRGYADARWHHDLDAAARIHAHRQAPRAPADAHVPRRADLAIGPQRQLQRLGVGGALLAALATQDSHATVPSVPLSPAFARPGFRAAVRR